MKVVFLALFVGLAVGEDGLVAQSNMNVSSLEVSVQILSEELLSIRKEVQQFTQAMQEEDRKHNQHLEKLTEENLKMKQELFELRRRNEIEFIGFFAYRGTDSTTYAAGDTIVFSEDIVNRGPENPPYDPTTGKFRCSQPGFYYFSFTLLGLNGDFIYASLLVGGVEYAWAHSTNIGAAFTATNSAVVLCDTNQEVHIRVLQESGVFCCRYSTFTGYLLNKNID